MNSEILGKIKRLRVSKGLNHSEMADRLHITRSAYQRLESGENLTWAKYLEEILSVFETTPQEFFSDIGQNIVNNQHNYEGAVGYNYYVAFSEKLIEQYELRIKQMEEMINELREQVNFWKKQKS